jgi:hypothetical protein
MPPTKHPMLPAPATPIGLLEFIPSIHQIVRGSIADSLIDAY